MTQPNPGEQRIGDDERAQTISMLGEHYSRGRIDLEEYEQRVTRATQARTARELSPLFSDLPAPHPLAGGPPTFFPPMPPPGFAAPPTPPGYPSTYYSDKSKVVAGLLQLFLPFGIGRFYTGHTGIAVAQLLLVIFGFMVCGMGALPGLIWCLVDGITLLAGSSTDSYGRPLRP